MGSRIFKVALVATAVLFAGVACVPPQPVAPIRVTTEANTFDGVCDEVNCSLLDAINHANITPNPNNLPNEIRIPAGTYVLTGTEPVQITRPVVINGAGRTTTTLDLTGSPITAPAGVIDPQFPVIMTGIRVQSTTANPTHVLASCAGHLPKAFSLISSAVHGLAAASTACDAIFVSTDVVGPASVISANTVSGTGSRLPFPDEPIELRRFSFLNSVITGPSTSDGETVISEDSVLTIHAPDGINMNGSFTGTHFERVGLVVGEVGGGAVTAYGSMTSFDLAGNSGPLNITIVPTSSLQLTQSTVYGGGAAGAVVVNGNAILRGATIANAGPALVVGPGATVMARRSILSAFSGPVCTAPISLAAFNLVVGSSCGTPSATDVTVANHAALQLGPVDGTGSRTPTYSMMPAATSPAVDSIPTGLPGDLDCPFNAAQNTGTSIDQRGFVRPVGSACDRGAVEYQAPAPPAE